MHRHVGDSGIDGAALVQMQKRGGQWAAYQNVAMDSAGLGLVQFIKYGPGCTHETPPAHCPDTSAGLGWKFVHVGFADLTAGIIVDKEPNHGDG
jgi:hypothetical protein